MPQAGHEAVLYFQRAAGEADSQQAAIGEEDSVSVA